MTITDVEKSMPYHEMTDAERLVDRIAKNRRSDQAAASGNKSVTLDGIVAQLNGRKQRATYGAVAGLVGVLPQGLMSGRRKCHADSWIVAATTADGAKRGGPTGYTKSQIHPECYRQICASTPNIIELFCSGAAGGECSRGFLGCNIGPSS